MSKENLNFFKERVVDVANATGWELEDARIVCKLIINCTDTKTDNCTLKDGFSRRLLKAWCFWNEVKFNFVDCGTEHSTITFNISELKEAIKEANDKKNSIKFREVAIFVFGNCWGRANTADRDRFNQLVKGFQDTENKTSVFNSLNSIIKKITNDNFEFSDADSWNITFKFFHKFVSFKKVWLETEKFADFKKNLNT